VHRADVAGRSAGLPVPLSVFSFDNLIRKVARDVGLPLKGDVPMLMRVGAFSFLMTLVRSWCRVVS
jgi:hypothetical protein